jgi:hypothetical protein
MPINADNLDDLAVKPLNGRQQAILRAALSFAFSNVTDLNEALGGNDPDDFDNQNNPIITIGGTVQTTLFTDEDFNNLHRRIFGDGI